jgi:hypothetical protein
MNRTVSDTPDPDVAVVAGAHSDGAPVTLDAVVNQPNAGHALNVFIFITRHISFTYKYISYY